jgi:3-hydroxyisobutyrate dehydrogenase-like beta-hydroxyacid dehydrogenase
MNTRTETIGFVGVGLMGHGIARNLLRGGYALTVYGRRNRPPVDDLVGHGAVEAGSIGQVARDSTIVFLCLSDSAAVEAVVAELRPGLRPDAVVVDCSTSDPTITVRLADELARQSVHYCDAPLGGTPEQAEAGQLQVMAGAREDVFQRLQPVFSTWATKIVRLGGVGDGHRMKLVNNFLSLGYGALYSEALAIAGKVGLTPAQVDNVIRSSRMDCAFYRTFMAYTLAGDRDAHKFTLTNAYKDTRYVEAMAAAAGCAAPLAGAVKDYFAMAVAAGGDGPEDYLPHLPDYVARRNGLTD